MRMAQSVWGANLLSLMYDYDEDRRKHPSRRAQGQLSSKFPVW